MVMKRVTFLLAHEDYSELKKTNDRLDEQHDSETKISARIRIIIKKFLKEQNK